jgi:hypothetical protein
MLDTNSVRHKTPTGIARNIAHKTAELKRTFMFTPFDFYERTSERPLNCGQNNLKQPNHMFLSIEMKNFERAARGESKPSYFLLYLPYDVG